jgi:ubiquinone/menaquinone biosynthesis C-methylase UbiE
MTGNDLRTFAEYYDQIYLKRKDYQSESKVIKDIIRRYEKKSSKTLLDVGCGTGEHLKYLSESFRCTGIDINEEMIKIAKAKVPDAEFEVADMVNFRLNESFDVVTCLFSSIGYVQNLESLVRTLRSFHIHLGKDGLTLVEPWIFKKDFRKGNIAIDTYEDEKTKLARMSTSKLTRSKWLVYMHYLVGQEGKIKHVKEIHKMIACNYEEYLKAFKLAGYKEANFLGENQWTRSRGLFVALG